MPRLLQAWITRQADTRPERVAVVSQTRRMTYGELDALSNQIARRLRGGGCRRGDRVVLIAPKSPVAVAGLLGIYKADCVYVPVDPASPAVRLRAILESCGNRWVLAAGPRAAGVLGDLLRDDSLRGRLSVGWLESESPGAGIEAEFTLDDVTAASAEPIAADNGPDDTAHMLFTSGSTGVPKGVVITHAAVIACIEWATKYFAMDASDRVSAHAPFHFDLSFFDIFGAAAVGAQIHQVPPGLNVLPNKLAEFMRASQLTQWFSVPSVLGYLASFDAVEEGDFPTLRRLMWAGEVLPTPTLMYWMKRLPHVAFTNLYGPTETTIVSSYYTVPRCPDDPQASIPIGAACEGEELLVLDEASAPVADGDAGELYIAGVGLAREYWRDPERTAAAFVAHPTRPGQRIYRTGDLARVGADGAVYFLGRRDSQIKSRGYRIELGEIEAALNAVEGLHESAVVAIETDGFEGAVICAAYVPTPGTDATTLSLARQLRRRIPGYMVPVRWLAFDSLPRNANGKVDRSRLKQVFETELDAHAAQTA